MLNTSNDQDFQKLNQLSWLPWVGENYFKNTTRLLIVGESQYAQGDTENKYLEDYKNVSDCNFTRRNIQQTQFEKHYHHFPLENLIKASFPNNNIKPEILFKNIGFFNVVQRIMNYSTFEGKKCEKPSTKDFDQGLMVFVEIVKILKPTDCIFIGVAAATPFERMMDYVNVERTARITHPKIGNTSPRTSTITIDNLTTKISFIKHTSAFFPESWRPFIRKEHSTVLDDLAKL